MQEPAIVIHTAQNIELVYPIASVSDRIKAYLIDLLVMVAYALLVFYVLELGQNETLVILGVLPIFTYSLWSELLLREQTIGKKLMNLKVIRLDGRRPEFIQIVLRWLARMIDTNPAIFMGLPAIVAAGSTRKGQRLGDLLAGTTVIRVKLDSSFDDTMFMFTDDRYEVRFPEIRNLRDKDVAILKEVLDTALRSHNVDLMEKLARRVKEVLQVTSNQPHDIFLETVLRDYNHIFGQGGKK